MGPIIPQLSSSGVLETVRIRKAGYIIRFPFEYVRRRYYCLAAGVSTIPQPLHPHRYRIVVQTSDNLEECRAMSGRDWVALLYGNLDLTTKQGQLGKTKLFLRSEGYQVCL